MMEQLYLIYSAEAARKHGTLYYITQDGELIEVTAVAVSPDWQNSYKFEDAKCVFTGLAKYRKKGRTGESDYDYLRK